MKFPKCLLIRMIVFDVDHSMDYSVIFQDEILIHQGRYYRLTDVTKGYFTAWQIVSEDKSKSLVNLVITSPQPNPEPLHIRFKGLDPNANYHIEESDKVISGAALMKGGYTYPVMHGDYPAMQLHLTQNGE